MKVLQTMSRTTSFFGNEAEGDSESDESHDSSDDESSAQRIFHSHGAASAASVSSGMPEMETVGDVRGRGVLE